MDSLTAYPDDVRLLEAWNRIQELTSPDPSSIEPWTADSTHTDFTTDSTNYTNNNNTAFNATDSDNPINYKYIYVPALLVIFCAVSVVINIKVLVSAYWIKRPLSPTLHISLSLAGADAFASFHLGLGLFINSLLQTGLQVEGIHGCIPTIVEVFRLGGVIITVAHLLALAVNHYLGILKPLHYPSIMTHRNRSVCIALMWLIPITFFLVYFSVVEGEGFQSDYCNVAYFMGKSKFRLTYSSLFFCPLILMSIIYTHIFIIVHRHQRRRLRFSQWSQYSRENHDFPRAAHQQRDITMSVKAIKTTLLILGSYVVGLMPAGLVFCLVCDDCATTIPRFIEELGGVDNSFAVFVFINFLVIFKTMLNPIIYAARMHEIKKASSIMRSRLCRCCCRLLASDKGLAESTFGYSTESTQHGGHRLNQYTESSAQAHNRSNTVVCRLKPVEMQANNGARRSLARTSTRSHQRRRAELTQV